jgi:hypothetical protein
LLPGLWYRDGKRLHPIADRLHFKTGAGSHAEVIPFAQNPFIYYRDSRHPGAGTAGFYPRISGDLALYTDLRTGRPFQEENLNVQELLTFFNVSVNVFPIEVISKKHFGPSPAFDIQNNLHLS